MTFTGYRSRIACLGFCAVDYVYENDRDPSGPMLGGSAANVAAILSHKGSNVSFIGTVGKDSEGGCIRAELGKYDVDTSALITTPFYKTPFCFQLLSIYNGRYVGHSFETSTPDKRLRSSRYALFDRDRWPPNFTTTQFDAVYINKQDPAFFDLLLDKTLVYYEPDYIDNLSLHEKITARCDVLKFSHAQFIDCGFDIALNARKLVIETFGAKGVAYRATPRSNWNHTPAEASPIVDASGAGDWFSASILDDLVKRRRVHEDITEAELAAIIRRAGTVANRASQYRTALGWLRTEL